MIWITLILLLAHADRPVSYCADIYQYSCQNPNLNDGTGSNNPKGADEALQKLTRETFPAFLERVKARAIRDPQWGREIAGKVNGASSSEACTADLACVQAEAIKPILARMYLNGLGMPSLYKKTPMPVEGVGALPTGLRPDMMKALSSDLVLRGLAASDEPSLRRQLQRQAQPVLDRVKSAFIATKTEAVNFINQNLPVNAATKKILNQIRTMKLEVGGEKSLRAIVSANAYYDEGKVLYSSGFALTSDSLMMIASTLAHEIAHSFDPCNYTAGASFDENAPKSRKYPFRDVIACLRGDRSLRMRTFPQFMRTIHPNMDTHNPFSPAMAGEDPEFMARLEKLCKNPRPDPAERSLVGEYIPLKLTEKRFKQLQKLCPPFKKFKYESVDENEERENLTSDGLANRNRGSFDGTCSENDQAGEGFSDWFSAQILPGILDKLLKGKKLTPVQYANGIANLRNETCSPETLRPTEFDNHPDDERRVQAVFSHPEMLRRMNCPQHSNFRNCAINGVSDPDRPAEGERPVGQ